MKARTRFYLLCILALVAFPFSSVIAQETGPIYVVQPGDTLTGIALVFGTTVEALVTANNIADPSLLFPGMELIIPGYEEISGVLTIQEIGYGETLSSLSFRYGTPSESLARLNRIINPGRIYAGQPLILVDTEGDIPAILENSLLLPQIGESKLELAVRTGTSPWSLTTLNQREIRMWVVPGIPLVVPGGEQWAGALPHPILSVDVDPLPAVQGRTTTVHLELSIPGWVEGRLEDRKLNFFPLDSHQWVALQGIHAMADPGLYNLEVQLYASEGGELTFAFSQPVRVREGGYGFETINGVPAETIDPDVVEPEEEMVASLLSPATLERHWEDTLQFPSDYYTDSFVSIFGTRRSYNYGAYHYYHTGLDFYGSGVPILAPALGQVVFAGSLVVRGNATYIDHGWGVYSGYFHQSEIYVSEGDFVDTGQVIGKVGGTGRSTGPHLHWEIWVGGVPVDPLGWVEKVFP